uniref:Integrase, catalytic region, zinc finger, CCHC-type, peptidase aspartic, catalytic n=1 Tax=Tanacetum cinerariifolium TaxID=118510 RepID=A0A699HT89_TANCI|nr:integrase, catalytic region, zinc finger, CCHC-type, peptidase aspartic, catalytic [Tanacetum cinerariifolium]
MKNIKMTMLNIQQNSKFVNNMTPEWDRFVTVVKLNKGLKETNHEQLYANLKHGKHAAYDRLINDIFNPITNDSLVLGRHNQNQRNFARGTGVAGNGSAQNKAGNTNQGQGTPIECYNCGGFRHIARNCTQPKLIQNSDYFKEKMLLMQAQENGDVLDEEELLFLAGEQANTYDADVDDQPVQDMAQSDPNIFQADDCDTFDSDVNDEPTAQTIFMANLSSSVSSLQQAGPSNTSILSEALNLENAIDHHEIPNEVQQTNVLDSNSADMGNINVIPYEQYVKYNEESIVHNGASSVQYDDYMLHENSAYVPDDSFTTTLNIYKDQRITPTGITEGERGFEQTKCCYLTEVIPFFKLLKEHFERVQKTLVTEVKEMKEIFKSMEAKVDQNAIDLRSGEIERKDRLITNENLITKCIAQDVFYTITNSALIASQFHELPIAYNVAKTRAVELEAEIINLHKKFKGMIMITTPTATGDPIYQTLHFRLSLNAGRIDRPLGVLCGRTGHSLFFVGQFCDSDLEVAFKKHTCFVRDLDGVDLIIGTRGTNLYTISVKDMMQSSPICLLSKASNNKSWLWHRRLNHLNFGTTNDLARKDFVHGLPILKFNNDHLCSACQLGKSKKYTHKPKTVNTIVEVLHTLHMDLCGPMRVQSINGKKYIFVIIDDYSRFTWVKFLRTKDETPKAKADIGFFVGYAPDHKGYRIYNKRTRKIMEIIHVTFDELTGKTALDHISSRPTPNFLTPGYISSRLVQNLVSPTPYVPPSKKEYELLFQQLFGEHFNP